jgi:hypothetical protein
MPGIAIENVLPAGGKSYEIVLSRSGMDVEEEVALFYGPKNRPEERNLIAGTEELGDSSSYVWDAGNVTAGNYYVYARISNGERRPFTYRYEDTISITGDPSKRMVRQPKVKVVKDGLKVRWQKLNRSDVEYYRVYFTDTVNQRGYGQYLDFPAHRASGLLDHEVMVPGRFYRLATAAIFADGTEGPLSNPRRLRYISKSTNNPPFFPFAPEDRVSAGGKLDFHMRARDYDKDTLRYSLLRAPEGATLNPGSGRLEWSPGADQAGYHLFQVSVRDDQGDSESINWNVFVGSPSEQGILDARSIVKSTGEKGYVLAYWNPHLNVDPRKPELLHGKISNSASPGTATSITFHESGADSGYFAAVVTEAEMQSIRAASVGTASVNSRFLDDFLVEITGEGRKEKTIISLDTQ